MHRRVCIAAFWLALLAAVQGCGRRAVDGGRSPAGTNAVDAAAVAADECERRVAALAEENERLRAEVAALRTQMDEWVARLAEERFERDRQQATEVKAAGPEAAEQQALVDELLARLASERFARDRGQLRSEQLPVAAREQVDVAPAGWRVLDVNVDQGLVALDAGAGSGLRAGVAVAIVREGAVLAQARVVEVRDRVTGARVEALAGDAFPAAGDRAVIWRTRRE